MKLKKLISTLLVSCLAVSVTAPAFAYTDVPDTNPYIQYANENHLYHTLDKNGKFSPQTKVTIKEFAEVWSMYDDNVISFTPNSQNFQKTENRPDLYDINGKKINFGNTSNFVKGYWGLYYGWNEKAKAKAMADKSLENKVFTWGMLLNTLNAFANNNYYGYIDGASNPQINALTGVKPLPKATKQYTNLDKLGKWQRDLVVKHNDFLQLVYPQKEIKLDKPITRIELVKVLKTLGPLFYSHKAVKRLKSAKGRIALVKRDFGYPMTIEEQRDPYKMPEGMINEGLTY